MSRGLWESLFGLVFSWLPGVGLLFSVAGFCRQAVRLTEAHKARRVFTMAFASVVLVVSVGGLVGEAYLYSRDPDIIGKTGLQIWQKVTGQETLPGADTGEAAPSEDGSVADDTSVPDEYHTSDGQVEEGDVPADGQMEEGDVPADGQMEEGDVTPSEGDFQDNIDFNEDDTDETPAETAGDLPEVTIPPLSDLLKSNGVAVG